MAKNKKKTPKKPTKLKKTLNPFEVHINKEKMAVLGRKTKNDRGLPGVSRAKALKKRKHTLLQEYKSLNKSNQFVDTRIGEKNRNMTEDDKMTARFTALIANAHKNQTFDLEDEEVLTHKNQLLSEIEKFDDPRSDIDDDDDDIMKGAGGSKGKLDPGFVEDAHFGGGVFKKTDNDGYKSHKELIDELILESKKRKAEQQKMKRDTDQLTKKLDAEWKDLMPLMTTRKKDDEQANEKSAVPKADNYDKVMRELKFEARGTVSDRLKTEDELAKEEKEKLEELEKERLERMKGFIEKDRPQTTHRSADDLDDDIVYELDAEYMLTYDKEGESTVAIDAQINGKIIGKADQTASNDEEDDEVEDEEQVEEEEGEGEEETPAEDDLSDLKASSDESDQDDRENSADTNIESNEKVVQITDDLISTDQIKKDLLKRKEIMEKARQELPYTFKLPQSYESLETLLKDQSSTHQSVILERMIKCNHPSLGEGNKEQLGALFTYLLQYLNDCACDVTSDKTIKDCFDTFNCFVPYLYDLAQMNPESSFESIKEVLKEKHEDFKKRNKHYPGLEVLIFLKLVGLLFSTSDFRHQVVTPAFVFMEQMLNKCGVRTKRDISYGLFLTILVLEYSSFAKRYSPAAINFLGGVLHMAIPKHTVALIKVKPPFKLTNNQLVLLEDYSSEDVKPKMELSDLLEGNLSDQYKIRSMRAALKLVEDYDHLLSDLPSNIEIFDDVRNFLTRIPTDNYPSQIQELFKQVTEQLDKRKCDRRLVHIKMEAARPKVLRLYEPKIEEVYDGKRRKMQSREKAEREKLLHKLKKETKGALREIRRDTSFLGRVKIQERIKSDRERREKVKRIYSEAAVQQSELNQMERKNKRK